jgi:hypothetical protein
MLASIFYILPYEPPPQNTFSKNAKKKLADLGREEYSKAPW